MARTKPTEPTDPKRVRSFALFFKNYMNISTLIVAALPVPVTSLGFIPTFAVQTKLLSVYTSLFCFLLLGFIFYLRHSLARIMFGDFFDAPMAQPPGNALNILHRLLRSAGRSKIFIVNVLPLLFIAISLVLTFQYNDVLKGEVNRIRNCNQLLSQYGESVIWNSYGACSHEAVTGPPPNSAAARTEEQYPTTFKGILSSTDLNDITYSSRLMIIYVGIFITAEAAFILMAIKEYLQDLLGLSDMDLIKLRHAAAPGIAPSTNGESSNETAILVPELERAPSTVKGTQA